MAAAYQTKSSSCHNSLMQRTSPECSIIVDDVDENSRLGRIEVNGTLLAERDERSSHECVSKRIEEFQRAAEGRKIEFERLLEEHAQVIRKLKQMEECERVVNATRTA